jgi:predicted dehydrogenase
MKDLRIGLIGVVRRGVHAWQAHDPEKGVRIVAGADTNPDGLKEFQEKFPETDVYSDYHEMIKRDDIDAVFISTPDFLHEEMAVDTLKAGKAVYLEKPMAITIEGCDRILRTAMETGSKLYIGHNMRHYQSMIKMKQLIDSGIIGEVQTVWCRHFVNYGGEAYFRDWHSEQRYANGLLLQKGSHDIDIIHWLMGSYTKRVVGMGMLSVFNRCKRRDPDKPIDRKEGGYWPSLERENFSPIIDVEDHNMVMMQLENGAQAAYLQCHYTPDAERNYTFIGTSGKIENIGDAGACAIHVWTSRGRRSEPDIIYKLKPLEGNHGGADGPIVQNFIDFVRNGAKTSTSPIAARNAVAVGVLGHESMRNGCFPKDIPPLPDDILKYFENNQQK